MSRKHAHRAGNQPVTRRYVAGVVRRARDEIISAIVHADLLESSPPRASAEHFERLIGGTYSDNVARFVMDESPSIERIERAVNG